MPNPSIHQAAIGDDMLTQLVESHRDNAGRAERLHSTPADQQRWRDTQNAWADIFQELLDRRRADRDQEVSRA